MIVVVWLLFSWMAHAGSNPREIVKEIQEGRGIRWQRANDARQHARSFQSAIRRTAAR